MRRSAEQAQGLGPKLALLWTGLILGVAFLATPAKFLAPSISLPVALDVGRHTFMVANRVELALCLVLAGLAARGAPRRAWLLAFTPPALLVGLQTLWLIPALDARVGLILAGQTPPSSGLHGVYVAVEGGKALWLAVLGVFAWPWRLNASTRLGRVLAARDQIASLHGWR